MLASAYQEAVVEGELMEAATGQVCEYRHGQIEYQCAVFAVDLDAAPALANHMCEIIRTHLGPAERRVAWPLHGDERWIREPSDDEVRQVLAEAQRLRRARQVPCNVELVRLTACGLLGNKLRNQRPPSRFARCGDTAAQDTKPETNPNAQ